MSPFCHGCIGGRINSLTQRRGAVRRLQQNITTEVCKQLNATLIGSLGAGAFKNAYLIEHEGNRYALKIALVSGELKARFEREVTALKGCAHPAIAKIITSGPIAHSGEDYWVIVEEYLPFGTLAERASQTVPTLNDIRHFGIVLADALGHLADRGFVHRDIKPANILFRTPTEPVLTDFGIVRVLGEKSLTQDFMAQGPGTPQYSAPEQLLNEKSAIDWRTDQFGLALVLAELLIGYHAFSQKPSAQSRDAIISVASRETLPPTIQDHLKQCGFGCLIKALSPWPVQRYRRPDDFIRAISGEN